MLSPVTEASSCCSSTARSGRSSDAPSSSGGIAGGGPPCEEWVAGTDCRRCCACFAKCTDARRTTPGSLRVRADKNDFRCLLRIRWRSFATRTARRRFTASCSIRRLDILYERASLLSISSNSLCSASLPSRQPMGPPQPHRSVKWSGALLPQRSTHTLSSRLHVLLKPGSASEKPDVSTCVRRSAPARRTVPPGATISISGFAVSEIDAMMHNKN